MSSPEDAKPESDVTSNEGNTEPEPGMMVNMRSSDGRSMSFRMKKDSKMYKLVNVYCKATERQMGAMRFLHDGERLDLQITAEEAGIKDGDVIDVLLAQAGGSN